MWLATEPSHAIHRVLSNGQAFVLYEITIFTTAVMMVAMFLLAACIFNTSAGATVTIISVLVASCGYLFHAGILSASMFPVQVLPWVLLTNPWNYFRVQARAEHYGRLAYAEAVSHHGPVAPEELVSREDTDDDPSVQRGLMNARNHNSDDEKFSYTGLSSGVDLRDLQERRDLQAFVRRSIPGMPTLQIDSLVDEMLEEALTTKTLIDGAKGAAGKQFVFDALSCLPGDLKVGQRMALANMASQQSGADAAQPPQWASQDAPRSFSESADARKDQRSCSFLPSRR